MKKLLSIALLLAAGAVFGTPWHFPLYLDGGVPAEGRIAVDVSNSGEKPAEGDIIKIPASELGLVGKKKKSIRVVGENGGELLWAVHPDAERIGKKASIILPVDCAPSGATRIWIYYNANAALEQPDYLDFGSSMFRESFEKMDAVDDCGWSQKDMDADHTNSISTEVSHKGKKSVHTHVREGAKANWIAVKRPFAVTPSKGKVSMWVKSENARVVGNEQGVRFYVAVFPVDREKKTLFFFPKKSLKGTQDWTKLETEVEIPEGYKSMNIGTVAHISGGDAYFDSLSLELKRDGVLLSYKVEKPEKLSISRELEAAAWDVSPEEYDVRMLASVFNVDSEPSQAGLGYIPFKRVTAGNFPQSDLAFYRGGKKVDFMLMGEYLLFQLEPIAPKTEVQYSLYLKRGRKNQIVKTGGTKQSSYVMSDQQADTRAAVDADAFEKIVRSNSNLLKNPMFEKGLEAWSPRAGTTDEAKVVDIDGKKALNLKISKDDRVWYGMQQNVVVPRGSYMYIVKAKSKDRAVRIPRLSHSKYRSRTTTYVNGKTEASDDWQFNAIVAQNRFEKGTFVVNINETGLADCFVSQAFFGSVRRAERYEYKTAFDSDGGGKAAAWQVNSVVKVFPFYAPPLSKSPAKIALARNEVENLQVAIRANTRLDGTEICVSEAVSADGSKLSPSQTAVAGYVVVDSKSNYYGFTELKFHELCVPPNSMAEVYPDPIIPRKSFDIAPNKTESVWIEFKADENTKAGVYKGVVEFKNGGKIVESLPYEVRVFDFALPKKTHLMALFDKRSGGSRGGWRPNITEKGITNKFYDRTELQRFMATKRVSVDHPDRLEFKIENGKYSVDFTEFDKFCRLSFEELGLPMMYLNLLPGHAFGNPIPNVDGIRPYGGKWPYSETKDYTQLKPEYVNAVSQRVKLVYDHIREKGWAEKFILFMSDEPYYWEKNIAAMLNTYFGLIHKNAPEARIYTSTWGYAEPLEKQVNVWGLNVSAAATPAEIVKIDAQGQKKVFTTDGNYCIDTPYNAQERIMAAFCFAGGFLGYEYWGVDWYMQNPFKWGMHKDRISAPAPGIKRRNRFPNGDGYFIYSGEIIGRNEIFSSVRMESVRDGQEDFEYFLMLEKLAKQTGDKAALATVEKIKSYAVYPNPGARNSAEFMPNPDAYTVELRNEIAEHIERLSKDSK